MINLLGAVLLIAALALTLPAWWVAIYLSAKASMGKTEPDRPSALISFVLGAAFTIIAVGCSLISGAIFFG